MVFLLCTHVWKPDPVNWSAIERGYPELSQLCTGGSFHFDSLFHHFQFRSHLFFPKFLLLLLDLVSKLLLMLEFGSEFPFLGLLTSTSLSFLQDLAQLGFHFQKLTSVNKNNKIKGQTSGIRTSSTFAFSLLASRDTDLL